MKLKVTFKDASEPDCRREDWVVIVDGKEHCICPSALGTKDNEIEALERARSLFGPDVELTY